MNQKILFVNHEPAVLNCCRQTLESKFDVATAGSGEEGLPLEPGEIVKVECGNREAPFRVAWSGEQGTAGGTGWT